MSGASDNDNMWSRRRAAVKTEAEAEVKAEAEAVVAEERAVLEEMSDEEALAELELPDPDSMEAGSEFSAFMKSAVPDRLRRRALRKLWLTNPVLANVDNLVDYGEDFTISTTLVENIQTIYRVGKGMLPDEEVDEAQEMSEELLSPDEGLLSPDEELLSPDEVDCVNEDVNISDAPIPEQAKTDGAVGESTHVGNKLVALNEEAINEVAVLDTEKNNISATIIDENGPKQQPPQVAFEEPFKAKRRIRFEF